MWHRPSCDGCPIFTAEQSRFKVMNKYYADCRNIFKNEAAAQITQLIMFILRMADFSNFIDVHFFCNLACLTLWSVCVPQVDRKEVFYIQTPVESVGWEAMDSMTFSVASPPASVDSLTFRFDISYENTGPEHNTILLANTGMNMTLQLC